MACDLAVAEQVVWAVTVASRYVPGRTTCLSLALTVQGVLARRGHPSRLHIGVVRGAEGQVDAHAWVECGGRVLIGGTGRRRSGDSRRLAVFDVEATFKLLAVESGQAKPMSAIAGLYRMDGEPVSRHEVERMVLALAHRGRTAPARGVAARPRSPTERCGRPRSRVRSRSLWPAPPAT